MSLLAEEIVEEWLNRHGWFTIRGIKVGVDEIDILAIKPSGNSLGCRHIEVQASIYPISYVTPVPKESRKKGVGAYSPKLRSREFLETCVSEWVEKKFRSPVKEKTRRSLVDMQWSFELVVMNIRFEEELDAIRNAGVTVTFLRDIREELRLGNRMCLKKATGGDLVDLILFDSLSGNRVPSRQS